MPVFTFLGSEIQQEEAHKHRPTQVCAILLSGTAKSHPSVTPRVLVKGTHSAAITPDLRSAI